jgi:hypothetical protein
MRFVPTKTPEHKVGQLHRTRHLFVRQQTAAINAAHLAEFGLIAPAAPFCGSAFFGGIDIAKASDSTTVKKTKRDQDGSLEL